MIENCPNCGGNHYGSVECPYKSPPQIERAISIEKTRQMLAECRATDGGTNLSYDPIEDALDAIAEHLREDDTAYADGDEADWQAAEIERLRAERDELSGLLAETKSGIDQVIADHKERAEQERDRLLDGNRPLPYDREQLGRFVREAWIRWAKQQPDPKPSWLLDYEELNEQDKEADRQIGEAIARWVLIGDAARRALAEDKPDE